MRKETIYYTKFKFTDTYIMHIIHSLTELSFWLGASISLSGIQPTTNNIYAYYAKSKKVMWYGTVRELKESSSPNASFIELNIVDFLWKIS